MSVRIITDSSSDISRELAEEYNIEVLPINVVLGDDRYKDDYDFSMENMISWSVKHEKFPKFMGINPEEFKEVLSRYAAMNTDVVVITTDNYIISNYDCALHASTAFDNINIKVIDSRTYSSALVLLVLKAVEMAQRGDSADSITEEIERLKTRPEMHVMPGSIQLLRYTDYCPTVLKMGESILNAKYHFSATVGKDFSVKPILGSHDKSIDKLFESIFENYEKINKERIIVVYSLESQDYLDYALDYIRALDYFEDIIIIQSRAYSTSLGNKHSIGVGFLRRIS